ncbi:aldo/keto reductase family protein [Candidatus Mycoplasma mahonii]|uniref:aldo/keto reductase family protein n=1 Tax=Candidatus Mycoplasma mahonii TaxID=3004105 RepID=UPI0026ED9A26|nr:aldo/keto reductase [Candidatus Mycoplasma mahonii]WKX02289.1 aldo/keto reductase [Candidatus Mycoplasma mahonii]
MNKLPQIGIGTWQVTLDEVKVVVQAAHEAGYKHIDTAQVYNNEYQIGQAFKELNINPSDFYITSKVHPSNYRLHTYKSVQESLRRLGIKKLNLMLLHAPLPLTRMEDIITGYKELMRAKKDGLVDEIGVSNFTVDILEAIKAATGTYPPYNQIVLSPNTRLIDIEEFCKAKGIGLTGYSTLRSYFNPNVYYENSGMNNKQKAYVEGLAKNHHKNVGQILSKWAIQSGYHIIPKSVKPKRIKSNILVTDFTLTDEEMKTLDSWNNYSTDKMFAIFSRQLEDQEKSYEELTNDGLLFDKNFIR